MGGRRSGGARVFFLVSWCLLCPCLGRLGAVSSIFSGLLASECLGGLGAQGGAGAGAAAVLSSLVMALLPAHLSRSVGGGQGQRKEGRRSLAVLLLLL